MLGETREKPPLPVCDRLLQGLCGDIRFTPLLPVPLAYSKPFIPLLHSIYGHYLNIKGQYSAIEIDTQATLSQAVALGMHIGETLYLYSDLPPGRNQSHRLTPDLLSELIV